MNKKNNQLHKTLADDVLYKVKGHIATITLNRPQQANALGRRTIAMLRDACVNADTDPQVRVVVITGAGQGPFCAGIDLKEQASLGGGQRMPSPMRESERNIHETIFEIYKPTIASINGTAVAAGFEIALACDLRISVPAARFGMPEATVGMGANFASVILPQYVPRAIAMELLYTGRLISSGEAMALGLLNQLVEPPHLRDATLALAERIAENAPLSVQRMKHMAVKSWGLPLQGALRLSPGPDPYTSEDRLEGARAFTEKRKPEFRGR